MTLAQQMSPIICGLSKAILKERENFRSFCGSTVNGGKVAIHLLHLMCCCTTAPASSQATKSTRRLLLESEGTFSSVAVILEECSLGVMRCRGLFSYSSQAVGDSSVCLRIPAVANQQHLFSLGLSKPGGRETSSQGTTTLTQLTSQPWKTTHPHHCYKSAGQSGGQSLDCAPARAQTHWQTL